MRRTDWRGDAHLGPGSGPDMPAGPVAKICGITRLEDLLAAVDAGAWAVGFVFAPSPRQVTAAHVARLIQEAAGARGRLAGRGGPITVGVFGNSTAEVVVRVAEEAGLDAVQLHGREGPPPSEVSRLLQGRSAPWSLRGGEGAAPVRTLVVRAVAVEAGGEDASSLRERIEDLGDEVDLVLLDTRSGGRFGGTGVPFPWSLARDACPDRRFLVAGGIGPANAAEAVRRSGAWGVDVSSGVEAAPGIKDGRAVRELTEALRSLCRRTEDDLTADDPGDIPKGGLGK